MPLTTSSAVRRRTQTDLQPTKICSIYVYGQVSSSISKLVSAIKPICTYVCKHIKRCVCVGKYAGTAQAAAAKADSADKSDSHKKK